MGVENPDVASPDTSTEATLDVTAESSPAKTSDTEPDFLSVVRSVVEADDAAEAKGEQPEADPAAEPEPEPAASQADTTKSDAQGQAEQDDENFSDAPFHNHPRFKKLIAQRNEFRAGHEQYRKIQDYLVENGLTGQEAAEGFEVMALLKRDPDAAWAKLKPIVQNLLLVTGQVLPDEMKARVQRGELSREAALELSRLRAGQQTAQQQREFERQRQEQMAAHAAAQAVKQEVGLWETAVRARDPDFDAKYDVIEGQVLRLQRAEGMPRTAAEAKAQLERAYQTANQMFAAQKPRRPEVRPVTGGRTAGTPQAEPTSMEEVVRRALQATRG